MHSHNIKQTEMHCNKLMMVFVCIVVVFLVAAGAHVYNREKDKLMTGSTETTTATMTTQPPTETTTTEETTTQEETTSVPETTVPQIETIVPETTAPETTEHEPPRPEQYMTLTESERLILATLIRLECGGSSYECQMAVASVVINRMNMFGLTLRDVVFEENVFSPATLIDRNTGESYYNPDKDGVYRQCWQVVDDICANGPTIPYYVIYFRSGYYHSWCTPWKQIGGMYFSYSEKYM